MNNSLISVVMSVYNSEKYLAEAIESILNQTYQNFEFIIINDGSTDSSLEIIQSYMKQDTRITLINRENKGLPYSLNEGIKKAKGEYIARMDADDISLPTRFEEQIKFMKESDIDICGGFIEVFGSTSKNKILIYPTTDKEIKFSLISMSSFAHPSIMMDRSIFDKIKYNDLKTAQDYDLWTQIALQNYKMGNIDKIILKYRIHSNQTTVRKRKLQKEITYAISKRYIENSEFKSYPALANLFKYRDSATYNNAYELFSELIMVSKSNKISDAVLINLMRFIFRTLSPMSPRIGIAYINASKRLKKDLKGDVFVLIQSFLFLDINNDLYNKIRNYIK